MHTGQPELIEWIRERIGRDGPVSFAWFMEQALYHPKWGFYSSGRCAIGRGGDYFTNVSVGPVFGRMLAAQFAEMWEILGRPERFTIVEQGAHHGDFAADVLRASEEKQPEFFRTLRYTIVEPFPILQRQQTEKLAEFASIVSWRENLNALEPFTGVHFSNELLDAMPVHLVRNEASGWQEIFVDEFDDGFQFVARPTENRELAKRLMEIPALSIGYETEVNLAAPAWLERVAGKLVRGYLLAVDYGYARDDFYTPERTNGTLRCAQGHHAVGSPLVEIGHADITAHVEWTSVAERGFAHGLDFAGFADQHHFLSALATGLCVDEFTIADARTRRMLQTLLHPTMLGRTFQFLALSRGVAPGKNLDGFRLAPGGKRALGLREGL
ncbi:MAG: SAM-dependent methyltransferase [Verrucomicrobiota bacterium]|nr:SAM-dependent methyltransferase [Verrucomicrobiota bacterium]